MKILVVDDEVLLVKGIRFNLQNEGYEVITGSDGLEAIRLVQEQNPDLVVLDVMMPNMDGITATAKIREFSNVPILLLTAKSETEDKVLGLNVGADDYITKPFVPVEVLARVRSHLRRYDRLGAKPMEDSGTITIGGIVLDDRAKTVAVDGDEVSLTPIEYEILKLLMENPGKVYSTRSIYETVWQENPYGSENAVAVHIRHLREKIEINPSEPRYIKVVWGRGYKMEVLK